LEYVGRLPHDYRSWISWGHTFPNVGNPPEKIENTDFVGVAMYPPYWVDTEFFTMTTSSGNTIAFYQIVPLYAEEMQLKLDKGSDELERLFEKHNISFIIDPNRKNVALKRKNSLSRFPDKK